MGCRSGGRTEPDMTEVTRRGPLCALVCYVSHSIVGNLVTPTVKARIHRSEKVVAIREEQFGERCAIRQPRPLSWAAVWTRAEGPAYGL